jgi:assimilatory nitrate reductase catalytic subunit
VIIVVDPRRTETAQAAHAHLRVRPKSDLELLYGVAHVLAREGWIDRDFVERHTTGYEAFARHVAAYPPERAAAATGLPAERVQWLARLIHEKERVSFWWTMGVNQSHQGVRTAQAIIALALMTGNIGRPGTGPNSITGQCNAMGSRLFANTTCLLGGRDFANAEHRAEVARILGIDVARIPSRPSLAYDEIIDEVRAGRIRALWVIGTNPAHSWIQQDGLVRALERLDVLAVQDMYASADTARLADVVLPAAGWGEKDGTFINSERRIGLIKKVRRAPGQALADFHIFRLVASVWGCAELFAGWRTPEDVFASMRELSRGRPCDITGIRDYAMLEAAGGIQWPFPEDAPDPSPERRLFADGRYCHPDGRARFRFEAPRALGEPPDEEFPLVLLTGRGSSSQWHTGTRTSKSAVLRKLARQETYVEIHPEDAAALGIEPEGRVRVTSRRASIEARAAVRETVRAGEVFMPMHFAETNRLTRAEFDPHSRQPSYKHCAVRVEPLAGPAAG